MLELLQPMQAEAPVVVGLVVIPAGHGVHVLDEVAWMADENFPATQLEHFFVVPSLYLPATQAVQAEVQSGRAVIPLANLADGLHLVQEDEPAMLPVPGGQSWHVLLPLKLENFPAVHVSQEVPDTFEPGAHALQVVVGPPVEYCSGAGQTAQPPDGMLYWP